MRMRMRIRIIQTSAFDNNFENYLRYIGARNDLGRFVKIARNF